MEAILSSFRSYTCTQQIENRGWIHRPINVLTMENVCVHHTTYDFAGGWHVLVCIITTPLVDVVGSDVFRMMVVIGGYGIAYWNVGSFCTAIYRPLYIRHEYWVKYTIRERVLLFIILFLSIIGYGSYLHIIAEIEYVDMYK